MADDIRALSDVLARDPASLLFADLAELLRRRGDVAQALRVAEQGLTRHPEHADGLVCLGRIRADRGELDRAREAWTRALARSARRESASTTVLTGVRPGGSSSMIDTSRSA